MLSREDRDALQEMIRREFPGLRAYARRLAGPEADDLLQEALVRACRAFPSVRDRKATPAWLRVIVSNTWRDRLRRRYRGGAEVAVADVEEAARPSEVPVVATGAQADTWHVAGFGGFDAADVRTVLRRLPPRYRRPLALRYLAGYATAEIADELRLPLGTVLSQLHRGRERFDRELRAYAGESGMVRAPASAGRDERRATVVGAPARAAVAG